MGPAVVGCLPDLYLASGLRGALGGVFDVRQVEVHELPESFTRGSRADGLTRRQVDGEAALAGQIDGAADGVQMLAHERAFELETPHLMSFDAQLVTRGQAREELGAKRADLSRPPNFGAP